MAGNRNLGSRAFWARELAAFWAVLMLTMGFSARPAAGWHFAYVTTTPNLVQVIDSSTNTVVAKVTVGPDPYGLAVAPDGKHVYVVSISTNTVSIIDTATNAVVATVRVGIEPHFVAVAPDGQHAYVANSGDGHDQQFSGGNGHSGARSPRGCCRPGWPTRLRGQCR